MNSTNKCSFCDSGMIITDEGESESCAVCEGSGKVESDPLIIRIQDLLWELFDRDEKKINEWLETPQECWKGISPLMMIHLNREQVIYDLLKNEVDNVSMEISSN